MDGFQACSIVNYQISIVIPTYNPNTTKLLYTLMSVVEQKRINFEIIISDDGSQEFPEQEIVNLFSKVDFKDYIVHRNTGNKGTVLNIASAFLLAKGEFIACISPGDMFYDNLTLERFYLFASENDLEICFGNAVHYYCLGDAAVVKESNIPRTPKLYNCKSRIVKEVLSHLRSNSINGTTYLRKRDSAIQVINWVSKYSKYVEDTTGLRYYLAANKKIKYLPVNYTWYERGGVSNSNNDRWKTILEQDIEITYRALKLCFPKDRVIDYAFTRRNKSQGIIRSVSGVVRHPLILLIILLTKLFSINKLVIDEKAQSTILNDKMSYYRSLIWRTNEKDSVCNISSDGERIE